MSSLSEMALRRPRSTLLATLILLLVGVWLALDFPSTEEPQVTIRTATVLNLVPGASAERVEDLVASPIEEAIMSMPEVRRVRTTVRPGFAFTYVDLHPTVAPSSMPDVWQRLRSKMSDVQPTLPSGTLGPLVDDEFGRVAVLTLGLTGKGYSPGEIRAVARNIRDRIQRVPGVERVTLHGVRDEQVTVRIDPAVLMAHGLPPTVIARSLAERNVMLPSGHLEVDGTELTLTVSGDTADLEALGATPVPLPRGGHARLDALVSLTRESMDPPLTAAFVDGQEAVVLAVSMDPGRNVISFADSLRTTLEDVEKELPAGLTLVPITDQAEIVTAQLTRVGSVFLETTVIVMGVVVLFLGLRTGLIVGAIVPTTVLGSLVVMRLLGIELHIISIGAIIIALGLFVDNAIVVAEDMERRLSLGEDRQTAAAEAGRTMFIPLLVSSLAIILTFMPLVLSSTETGEYLRSMGIVMAIALLLSLVLAVTVTPLLCQRFAVHHAELSRAAAAVERLTGWYRGKVRWVLAHRKLYVGVMVGLLVAAAGLFTTVPSELMPASERRQLQMGIELGPDASTVETLRSSQAISKALSFNGDFPEVASHALYMGDGGPRFILALNPPTPAAHRAYAVITLADGYTHDEAITALRERLTRQFPTIRFEPKRFSMGSSESGLAVFRIASNGAMSADEAANRLVAALRDVPDMVDIRSDGEHPIPKVRVDVDQDRAAQAGVSSDAVSQTLEMILAGKPVSQLRDGDTVLPVVLRGGPELRQDVGSLATLPIPKADGSGMVPLGSVATIRMDHQPSVIHRHNQQGVVTVTAKHAQMTALDIAVSVESVIGELSEQGIEVALGGEIEENNDANAAIDALLPACLLGMFLLFVWQFESLRKSLIVMASIPFVSIGAAIALKVSGTTLTFVGTLGLLALAGIIVNNAILLIDAIDEAKASGLPDAEAIEDAASKRLRPIVMTKLVCILGLLPLWLFGGAVWESLSVVMMGGLALGTLITLGLIPALYALFFRVSVTPTEA